LSGFHLKGDGGKMDFDKPRELDDYEITEDEWNEMIFLLTKGRTKDENEAAIIMHLRKNGNRPIEERGYLGFDITDTEIFWINAKLSAVGMTVELMSDSNRGGVRLKRHLPTT
jgi:hypothetical protein